MSTTIPTLPHWWPNLTKESPEVKLSHQLTYGITQEHEQALTLLKQQLTAAVAKQTTVNETINNATAATTVQSSNIGLAINNQTGTAYTNIQSDYGDLITFNNAAAVALTLSTTVTAFWIGWVENLGAGVVTMTPQSGTINGAANAVLPQNASAMLFWDGSNYWAATVPFPAQTIAAVAHKFLTAYNASTGVFTAAQPAFTDISGNLASAQMPSGGFSGTAILAKLTTANGSLTILDGQITAYVAPT